VHSIIVGEPPTDAPPLTATIEQAKAFLELTNLRIYELTNLTTPIRHFVTT